jgi:hypothetical protein
MPFRKTINVPITPIPAGGSSWRTVRLREPDFPLVDPLFGGSDVASDGRGAAALGGKTSDQKSGGPGGACSE